MNLSKLQITGMTFNETHGVNDAEYIIPGEYVVDVCLYLDLIQAGKTDNLSYTVDYEQVYLLVKDEMKEHKKLIETLTYNIGRTVLNKFRQVEKVKVVVSKINPPIKGRIASTSAEIKLFRNQTDSDSGYWAEHAKY